MADDKKAKKKKKKEEEAPPPPEPAAPANTPAPSKKAASKKKESAKKAKKGGGSNVFDAFSEKQIREFKEGFQFMDRDKDGVIGAGDIRSVCDEVGRMTSDKEIDSMLNDSPHPINFTVLLNMFSTRQQGGATDEDEVVIAAFKAFSDDNGMIDADNFKTQIMTFGEKYTAAEMDDFLSQVQVDDNGKFAFTTVIAMLTGKDEEEEEAPAA